jgi:DNA invertase Pin-like site-specific DNA recombinase
LSLDCERFCHLIGFLSELHALRIDLFLHQQGLDTSTPGGKAMFQMMGVFAEFERSMIQERVRAGLKRAKAVVVIFNRPWRREAAAVTPVSVRSRADQSHAPYRPGRRSP